MKIKKDFKAFNKNGNIKKKISTLLFNPCFHSVVLFRLSSFLYSIHLSIISKIIWYLNRILFHVDIDYRAKLAGGFVIVHGLGLVIGKDVISKGRLTVYQGVTIGGSGNSRIIYDQEIWQPIIEENVCVYSNAMILGPVLIGKDKIIKAGERVTRDC